MAQATRYEGCDVKGCGDTLKPGWPALISTANLTVMQGLNLDYVALGVILAVALFFFWTQKLRTDLMALLGHTRPHPALAASRWTLARHSDLSGGILRLRQRSIHGLVLPRQTQECRVIHALDVTIRFGRDCLPFPFR